MNHNENQTHPDRNATLSVRENPDGPVIKKPAVRDIVAEMTASAATWTEKCRAVNAEHGLFEVLKTLDHAREKFRNIQDAEYFERTKANRYETSAAEVRTVDIEKYRGFQAASDRHMENAQRIQKAAEPLAKEIDRLRAVYKVLNDAPPVQA